MFTFYIRTTVHANRRKFYEILRAGNADESTRVTYLSYRVSDKSRTSVRQLPEWLFGLPYCLFAFTTSRSFKPPARPSSIRSRIIPNIVRLSFVANGPSAPRGRDTEDYYYYPVENPSRLNADGGSGCSRPSYPNYSPRSTHGPSYRIRHLGFAYVL